MITIGTKAQALEVYDEVLLTSGLVWMITFKLSVGTIIAVQLHRNDEKIRVWWNLDDIVNKVTY